MEQLAEAWAVLGAALSALLGTLWALVRKRKRGYVFSPRARFRYHRDRDGRTSIHASLRSGPDTDPPPDKEAPP